VRVEAGVLHLEFNGLEIEIPVVWDVEQGGPIYAMKEDKIFLTLSAEELKALYVIYRDLELKGKANDN
jgi:hypothetical protein